MTGARDPIRCTVLDGAKESDVEVTFAAETAIDSLVEALPLERSGRDVYVGDTPLPTDGVVGDSGILAGCFLSIGQPGPPRPRIPDGAAGVIRVLAGPDVGWWAWARAGQRTTIGRSEQCDLRLSASDVSRVHAAIDVSGSGNAIIRDEASTNGTYVGGAAITEPTSVPRGGVFEICDDVIQWTPLDRVDDSWRATDNGRIEITRRYHEAPAHAPRSVDLPKKLPEHSRNLVTAATSLLTPIALGLVMFVSSRSPASLLMVLMAPLVLLVQQMVERRTRRTKEAQYAKDQARAAADIAESITEEEQLRRLNDPDELTLLLCAMGGMKGLWTKHLGGEDALTFRVGVRDLPASVELKGDRWTGLDTPQQHAVPVTVDLRSIGVLGVVGDPRQAGGMLRWILVQLASRRSPEDLELYLLSSDESRELAWARWLPHVDVGDAADVPCRIAVSDRQRADLTKQLADLVRQRMKFREKENAATFESDVVVVLDGARSLRVSPEIQTVLKQGPLVGVYSICVDLTDINECRGRVTVPPAGRIEVVRDQRGTAQHCTGEQTAPDTAETIARLLAPLRDAARGSGGTRSIPYPVRFLDILDLHTPTPQDVRRLWDNAPGPTTRVPLGLDDLGTVFVDLAEQGPHAMMGGTTGTGKSYLLQALVSSLLMHNTSDELNLVLVDFKGGAAFLPFVEFPGDTPGERLARATAAGRDIRCPQVVSLILSTEGDDATDFDEAAASRVIASLRSEVSRRERILSRYGGELTAYLTRRPATEPPLPRLVLIFDEFARVLDTAPDFMPQLVNVAGKGRSLGMHLLLATQSLSGKLTPELKNNVDLRISLRQNERADSDEVLDAPDAASIPGRLKGRGFILSKKDDPPTPRAFQAGHLGLPPPPAGADRAQVRIVGWTTLGDLRPPAESLADHGPSDLELTIAAIESAATSLGLSAPHRPLLPPLPRSLIPDDLLARATAAARPSSIPFALADDPSNQAQPAFCFPTDGSMRLMIAGGPQSGRTTAVRTIVESAASRFAPDDLHVYVIEREPAGLAAYENLPHCGGVFGPSEPDRIRRFVTWLGAEVARRDSARWLPHDPEPHLVVCIDGWELFYDPTDPSSVETTLVQVLRDVIKSGPPVGVHVIVTCDRSALLGRPGDLFDTRLVLPFAQDDIVRSLLPQGTFAPRRLKGRAVVAGMGMHMQIAGPETTPENALGALGALAQTDATRAPETFPPLPRQVSPEDVPRPADVTPTWIPLGLGGPSVEPFGIDLFTGPQVLLVSGAAGTGRSTAAGQIAAQLSAADGCGVVIICLPGSPVSDGLAGKPGVAVLHGPTVPDETLRASVIGLGKPRTAIVIDDCEKITVTPSTEGWEEKPTLLTEAVAPAETGRLGVVLCGDGYALLDTRRSLTPVARSAVDEGMRVLIGPIIPASAREHGFGSAVPGLEVDELRMVGLGRGHAAYGRDRFVVQLMHPAPRNRHTATARP